MTNVGATHKKQHWVPKSYLKAWAEPSSGKVWRFRKDGSGSRLKAPKAIFYEEDLYTIDLADGTRDLRIEHGLAGLESEFVRVRDQVLAAGKPLTSSDDLILRAFVAAMQARTRSNLSHWQNQLKDMRDKMRRFQDAMRRKTPEERRRLSVPRAASDRPSGTLEDMEKAAEGPVGPWVAQMIAAQLPTLLDMSLAILVTDDSLGFITSDRPCSWFDPEAYKLPPMLRSPGLLVKTIEVTLPASPRETVLLSWRTDVAGYVSPRPWVVDELNRRTRFRCEEHFVVQRNEKRDHWFDPGQPPSGPEPSAAAHEGD